jgi:hypothetical protein
VRASRPEEDARMNWASQEQYDASVRLAAAMGGKLWEGVADARIYPEGGGPKKYMRVRPDLTIELVGYLFPEAKLAELRANGVLGEDGRVAAAEVAS